MRDKLLFQEKIYFGDSMKERKPAKLKKKIEKNPLLSSYYVIAISENPNNQLDIIQTRQLIQSYYSRYPLKVVGVATDRDEAFEIIEKIAQECFRERGDCALREYLSCQ